MSHIACNSNNSFAVDTEKNLYTWGSHESGLLGTLAQLDKDIPTKIEVRNGNDEYDVESVNVGQFHAAIIANRKDSIKTDFYTLLEKLEEARYLFDSLSSFFEKTRIHSEIDFIQLLLIPAPPSKEDKKCYYYNDFEKYFLSPFFAYLKLKKKDVYQMDKVYSQSIKGIMEECSGENPQIKLSELSKLREQPDMNIKVLLSFVSECTKYFIEYPDDFKFFARIVFRFETFIDLDDIERLFSYCGKGINLKSKIFDKLLEEESEENKKKKKINANVLIDCILGKQTGTHNVFTWGIHTEGRLGYKDIDNDQLDQNIEDSDNSSDSNNNNQDEDKIQIQRIPKLVYFGLNVKIKNISCGFFHTLALSEDRNVYAWGSSKYGCLGMYLQDIQPTPRRIEKDINLNPFTNIVQIGTGIYMSLALDDKGKVFSWGLGNNGRLGHGDENSVEQPKPIQYFNEKNLKIKLIACGDLHCAAISISKELFTWGNGTYGKLGHCNFEHVFQPTIVGFFSMCKVESVFCGAYNTIAATTDGKLYGWGKNSHSMLGITNSKELNILIPTEVQYQREDPNVSVSEVAVGSMHQLILCTNGSILSCGNSVNGILGVKNVYDKITIPAKVSCNKVFYMKKNQEIKENDFFKLYSPNFTLELPFTDLSNAITYVDCSPTNTAFITNKGELYMSGKKDLIPGEFGENEEEDQGIQLKDKYIIKVNNFRNKVDYISLGKFHVICIADKKAYAWGKNHYCACGLPGRVEDNEINVPTLIEAITTGVRMSCASDSHSMVLTTNGEIFAFGSNMYGKLGIGDLEKYFIIKAKPMEPEPILVKNITSAAYIACSSTHSVCIMKYDQEIKDCYSVFTWGSGFSGKLGHHDFNDVYEPKVIQELEDKRYKHRKLYFVKVALGDEFTLMLDERGKLWGCGDRRYLPGAFQGGSGMIETPIMLCPDLTFKFIAAKRTLACAITSVGDIYTWGEMILEDKNRRMDFQKIWNEKMEFAAVGFNHFASIDSTFHPFTWGSNLYGKCGYEGNNDAYQEIIEIPKQIDEFYDKFTLNEENMGEEIRGKNYKMHKGKDKERKEKDHEDDILDEKENYDNKDLLQMNLQNEKLENKNMSLMDKDIKLNDRFFKVMDDFFKTMQSLDEKKTKLLLETEDDILSAIKRSKSKVKKDYKSEIPLSIAKNLEFFESLIGIVQMHPCYLEKIYDNGHRVSFMKICRLLYGENEILQRNKRVILSLMGLWNSIFSTYVDCNSSNLNESILYSLYSMLFSTSEENNQIAYELISISFLYSFSEVLKNNYFIINNKEAEELKNPKEFQGEKNKQVIEGVKKILINYISNLFSNLEKEDIYNSSVLWILSEITKKSIKSKSKEKSNDDLERILNFFILSPCQEIIKTIMDSDDSNLPTQYFALCKNIATTLVKVSSKGMFSELYNEFKNSQDKMEIIFTEICKPKTAFFKLISPIFKELALSTQTIENRINSLENYDYDFTFNSVSEIAKLLSEKGNEEVTIPIKLKDLLDLYVSFEQIAKDLYQTPFSEIFNDIKNFTNFSNDIKSAMDNLIINIIFFPYDFYFKDGCKMVKCEKCRLPIPEALRVKEKWEFDDNEENSDNDKEEFDDDDEDNDEYNKRKVKIDKNKKEKSNSFFKRYEIKYNDELSLQLEDVLYYLPPLYQRDDLIKTINDELGRLRDQTNKGKGKDKDNEKIKVFNEFKNQLNNFKETNQKEEKEIIKICRKNVEGNLNRRNEHVLYIKKAEDALENIINLKENIKVNFSGLEKELWEYRSNVNRGFVTPYFSFEGMTEKKKNDSKRHISKMFLAKDLIRNKVIIDIKYDGQEKHALTTKTYLEIVKTENGFSLNISYKESQNKFHTCTSIKHMYKLDEFQISMEHLKKLRRIARHNPVHELGEITFNTFYLVNLLNSLIYE